MAFGIGDIASLVGGLVGGSVAGDIGQAIGSGLGAFAGSGGDIGKGIGAGLGSFVGGKLFGTLDAFGDETFGQTFGFGEDELGKLGGLSTNNVIGAGLGGIFGSILFDQANFDQPTSQTAGLSAEEQFEEQQGPVDRRPFNLTGLNQQPAGDIDFLTYGTGPEGVFFS